MTEQFVTTTYLGEATAQDSESYALVELHRCNVCGGAFGIDSSFIEQVTNVIACPMCSDDGSGMISLAEPESV